MDTDREGASRAMQTSFPSSEGGSRFIEAAFLFHKGASPKRKRIPSRGTRRDLRCA